VVVDTLAEQKVMTQLNLIRNKKLSGGLRFSHEEEIMVQQWAEKVLYAARRATCTIHHDVVPCLGDEIFERRVLVLVMFSAAGWKRKLQFPQHLP
jgi:hypothetical protein